MRIRLFHVGVTGAVVLVALVLAASSLAAEPPSQLLQTYQPVTQFDPLESFMPTSVQSFITDSELERLVAPGTWKLVDRNPPPGDLPGPGTGAWRLNQDSCAPAAALGGLACYADAWSRGHGASTVYGRVTSDAGDIVLQYWYFYYDDVYSYTYPPGDFIWQAHEGDWEVVNVVLSENEQPLFVGYSEHCRGARRSWAGTTRIDETHPLVHVAIGSHANYFTLGAHTIDPTCIPQPALAFFQLTGLPLPADHVSAGPVAGPPSADGTVTTIRRVDDGEPGWTDFPGFWGELQYFHAPAPIGTVAFGTSPVGPAYDAIWRQPLATMAAWPTG